MAAFEGFEKSPSVLMIFEHSFPQKAKNSGVGTYGGWQKSPYILKNIFSLKGEINFGSVLWSVIVVGSLMVYERFYGPHEHFLGGDVFCAEKLVDQVILENRQANPGGQKSARRDEGNSWWNETSSEMRGAEGNGIGILEIFLIDALLSGIYR